MNTSDLALTAAGALGSVGAVIHGVLVQRAIMRPDGVLRDPRAAPNTRRLMSMLLHVSTFSWLASGLALIVVGLGLQPGARDLTCWLVGVIYLFAVIGGVWATRGRPHGWTVYAVALGLTGYAMLR